MKHRIAQWVRISTLIAAAFACGTAQADEPNRSFSPLVAEREILSGLGADDAEWTFGDWLRDNLQTEADHGFEVRRNASQFGDRELIFSIQGPMMKEKTPGLAFSVRF